MLAIRSLRYYWRTNLAVAAGVAIGVSVLAGAAAVGDSVRASLRDILLGRIGATDVAISATGLFREALAGAFPGTAAPLLAAEGVVEAEGGRRAYGVAVYGVDARFWR